MDQKQLVKQVLDFNKSTFDNAYSTMVLLQEQSERLGQSTLEQASWLPEEGRKAINDLTNAYRKGRDDFKKGVDEAYQKVEQFFQTT